MYPQLKSNGCIIKPADSESDSQKQLKQALVFLSHNLANDRGANFREC